MSHKIRLEPLLPRDALNLADRCATCRKVEQVACLPREIRAHPQLDSADIVLAPHTPLFKAGDEARCLFVVQTGYLKLVASRGTQEMVVRIAGPCSVIGLTAALFHGNHDLSAESLTRSQLWPIDRSALHSLMGKNDDVRKCIFSAICIESRILSEDVRRVGLNATAASRLGSLLVVLSQELGEAVEGRLRFPLVLSHEEIGSMVCTTRETVTRILSEFRKLGWIVFDGQYLTINDPERLAAPGTILPRPLRLHPDGPAKWIC